MRLALLLLLLQDPAALVEKLRSGGVEEREEAALALQELGAAAAPALEKAARDPDAEVAARAKALLRRIHAAELLGADLAREVPRVVDRLEKEKASALFADLVADLSRAEGERRYPGLRGPHLAPLARLAVPDCKDVDALNAALGACSRLNLRGVLPEILAILRGPADDLRARAAHYLIDLRAKEALPAVAELLEDPRSDVRRTAARILGELRAGLAVARLDVLLKDGDLDVRKAAAQALLSMNAWESAPAFRPLLRDPEPALREAAISAAGRWGDREAGPALVALTEKPEMRFAALSALWQLGGRDPAPFVARLADPDAGVQEFACYAAGQLGAREALPGLLAALRGKHWPTACEALQAIAGLGERGAAPELLPLLKSEHEYLRVEAIRTLGLLRHRPAVPALIEALKDPSAEVRRAALEALPSLAGAEAAAPVKALLADVDLNLRDQAAQSLEALAGEDAVPDLFPLRADPLLRGRVGIILERRVSARHESLLLPLLEAKEVENLVLNLLLRIGSLRVLETLAKRPEEPVGRGALIDLLAAAPPEAILPFLDGGIERSAAAIDALLFRDHRVLIPALAERALREDPSPSGLSALAALKAVEVLPQVRERLAKGFHGGALGLLGELGGPADLDIVRPFLPAHPASCSVALHRLGDPELVPTLGRLLRDPSQGRRDDLLRLAGELGLLGLTPAVEGLLKDADQRLRWYAVRALADLEDRSAVPAIRKLLEDPSDDVREAALEALLDLLDPAQPEAFVALLPRTSGKGPYRVLEELKDVGGPAQGPAVAAVLHNEDAGLVQQAIETLVAIRAREQVPALVPLLKHADEAVAKAAALALGHFGAPEALGPLLPGLEGGRTEARDALAGLKPEILQPALLDLASRDNDDVRENVAWLLGGIGGAEAKRALLGLLSDEDGEVQGAAATALARMKAVDAAPRIRLLLRVKRITLGGPHVAALRALASLGDRESIPEIRRLLRSSVGSEAVDALEALDAREAVPDLLALAETGASGPAGGAARLLAAWGVQDVRPVLRRGIPDDARFMRASARLGDREAIPAILRQLDRRDVPDPVPEALEALAELGATETAPRVRAFLTSGDRRRREAAIDALFVLDREALRQALAHRHPEIRVAVARRLCVGGVREGVPVLLGAEASLFPLNALRSPKAWAALAARPFRPSMVDRRRVLQALQASGVALEGRRRPTPWLRVGGEMSTAVEALEAVFLGPHQEGILEQGRVRLVSNAEARAFWSAWWTAGGKEEP